MWFDTHAHLDADRFDEDREAMIRRALDGGVERIVTIGTDVESSRRAIAIAETYDGVFAAVALHPTESNRFDDAVLQTIRELAGHPKVVAIGEIGLDYYWKEATPEAQDRAFRSWIRLACELDKPVVIHNREADADVIRILREEKKALPNLRGIMHCFSQDAVMLNAALELGFYISFSGNITYKKSSLPAILPSVPADRLLIETDAPYLPPVPFRGKRNEPLYVKHTGEKIAEILGRDQKWLADTTATNARNVFQI